MFLIDDAVAHRGRLQDGGAQAHIGQGYLWGRRAAGQGIAHPRDGVVARFQQGAHIGQGLRCANERRHIHHGVILQRAAAGAAAVVISKQFHPIHLRSVAMLIKAVAAESRCARS